MFGIWQGVSSVVYQHLSTKRTENSNEGIMQINMQSKYVLWWLKDWYESETKSKLEQDDSGNKVC